MNPKISVVVPVYKGMNTLERCIESIINQSYKYFEIIMVDDGSPDQSGKLCDELELKYKTLGYELQVIHQQNQGVSMARNVGISHATGKYFVCVDCDDVIKENYLKNMISLQLDYPDLGMVCCGFASIAFENKEYIYSSKEDYSIVDRRDYMKLYEKIVVQSPCLRLYRTNIVKDKNIKMRKDLSLGEDLIFNLEYMDALQETKYGIVNSADYIYYDIGDNSLNRKYRSNLYDIYNTINNEIKHYLIKWDAFRQESKNIYYNHVMFNYISVLNNNMSINNDVSFMTKVKMNDAVLKSDGFIEAFHNKTITYPRLVEFAYKTKSYLMVYLANKIQKGLSFIRRLV